MTKKKAKGAPRLRKNESLGEKLKSVLPSYIGGFLICIGYGFQLVKHFKPITIFCLHRFSYAYRAFLPRSPPPPTKYAHPDISKNWRFRETRLAAFAFSKALRDPKGEHHLWASNVK